MNVTPEIIKLYAIAKLKELAAITGLTLSKAQGALLAKKKQDELDKIK